jgi:hypothetical protein
MSRLLLCLIMVAAHAVADVKDDFWEAARKGDAKTVEALLAKGVDVNTKFRYGATALSYACDRGHTEVVKVLLAKGADVNVKDTFYSATPMSWAVQKGHTEIIKMLLAKGAEGRDEALMGGVFSGKIETVTAVLEAGGLKPDTLSRALARAESSKNAELAALLKKHGAVMPESKVQVPLETLKSYEGVYQGEGTPEFTVAIKEGKLTIGPPGQMLVLQAISMVAFQPLEFSATITFEVQDGKATSFSLKQGERTTVFKKVEKKP